MSHLCLCIFTLVSQKIDSPTILRSPFFPPFMFYVMCLTASRKALNLRVNQSLKKFGAWPSQNATSSLIPKTIIHQIRSSSSPCAHRTTPYSGSSETAPQTKAPRVTLLSGVVAMQKFC
uniref:(northern house mosquito) hypothetical protein n=1 Tax=Culex pipiens TaxID=7175 RepID=A0A8D8IQZ8_CULPI